jgi:squalene cyclase
MTITAITEKYNSIRKLLLDEMNQEGYWTGQLATSALSTSVAIVALKTAGGPKDHQRINAGFNWLCQHINIDGGYGDTTHSLSNVSTTLLCYAAIHYCQTQNNGLPYIKEMEKWLATKGITLLSDNITSSILRYYGKDYTFSIPILSMLTLCNILPSESLRKIPNLPFELTLLPASWYRFLNLRVVSYALPALIAVGIFLHRKRNKSIIRTGFLRNRFIRPALEKLDKLVPESGGFLEAIPLTGFVAMCLTESGYGNNSTVSKGLQFLRIQQREDGGWPIDTDLSTWVTTLSVKALGPHVKEMLNEKQVKLLQNHLLRLQYTNIHPFNNANPGGWGWTSFSGSVPDADDTPGAILALLELHTGNREEITAIEKGCIWLMDLQNTDGGFPTFCKGWGKLPFDKSCADLTGHALLALLKSAEMLHPHLSGEALANIERSTHMAMGFLTKHQSDNGAWLPLWFGNQHTGDQTNPVYGTAKVAVYLNDCLGFQRPGKELILHLAQMVRKAQVFLIKQQNNDGSWGGKKDVAGTIEETSLAVSALVTDHRESSIRGIEWLMKQEKLEAAPIGLYFALLWYDEKLYPLIYYAEALRRFIG